MVVQFRLKELMAEKERLAGERVTYRAIRDGTGLSTNTLHKIATNNQKMVGLDVIERLCFFFDCDIADLMVRVPDNQVAG